MHNTTKIGTDHCPVCDYKIDSATPTDDEKKLPNPGDLVICLNCGAYLKFSYDMALQELTIPEWDNLDDKTKVILNGMSKTIRTRGPLKPRT